MRLLTPYLRLTRKPLTATAERTSARLGSAKRAARPPRRLLRTFQVELHSIDGFSCYSVAPRPGASSGDASSSAVLYLHGGSYISPISTWHWRFISRLAAAGHRVEVPLYGLAPAYNHREAALLLAKVYRRLLDDVAPGRVTLMGDSAGGGLALAFAQQLAEYSLPQPRRLVLLSPWVDVAMENPELAAVEAVDPWLSRAGLRVAARAWAAGDDLADPRVSPINGPMSGLPTTDVFVGTHDLPYPDVLRLQNLMRAAGSPVSLHVADGAVHVYPLLPVPEGRAAQKVILELLRS
ncbi:alpha/beta hydrolase [Arthrobacter sp. zg-Y877]|uniref:alpha/beta hydrolase fold domain-containing protein n=1 Tax=Arthrobacter sp. zg-Y877 TaxID=3049074 RepID=UPI0025A3B409|nr:alpha/beta hydrolase [Arthrobacter sp. zg-Y877]MDM7988930.1 alpha/beta hydrolase [Arthrobacter sp. zg-Y877]